MAAPPKLFDRVRIEIRSRHYSRRTEETDIGWIKRFIFFHNKRHPASMGADEVNAFLSSLAVDGHVSATTQNQALSAILFLYRYVLRDPLPWITDLIRAERPERVPVVLTASEARAVMRDPKGRHDRVTPLPRVIEIELRAHLEKVRRIHDEDVRLRFGSIVPTGGRKHPLPHPIPTSIGQTVQSGGIISTNRPCSGRFMPRWFERG